MATTKENLQLALDNLAQQIADLTDPNAAHITYTLNGQNVDWTAYLTFLIEKREALRKVLQMESSPFWGLSKAKA